MKGYGLLFVSIFLEVFSTQMMKASLGFTKILPSIMFAVGMGGCFYVFSKALLVVPLGISYAIWAGVAFIVAGCALLNLRG